MWALYFFILSLYSSFIKSLFIHNSFAPTLLDVFFSRFGLFYSVLSHFGIYYERVVIKCVLIFKVSSLQSQFHMKALQLRMVYMWIKWRYCWQRCLSFGLSPQNIFSSMSAKRASKTWKTLEMITIITNTTNASHLIFIMTIMSLDD